MKLCALFITVFLLFLSCSNMSLTKSENEKEISDNDSIVINSETDEEADTSHENDMDEAADSESGEETQNDFEDFVDEETEEEIDNLHESDNDSSFDSDPDKETDDFDEVVSLEDVILETIGKMDKTRYEKDVRFIAKERTVYSDHWKIVQSFLFDSLDSLGYKVELADFGSGVNVIGTKVGTENPESVVILSGHYDHIPNCPGADDNASGVASALESARVLSDLSFNKTLKIIFWDNEEYGYKGSADYSEKANIAGEKIDGVFVYETMAFKTEKENSQSLPRGFDILFAKFAKEVRDNKNRGDFIALITDEGLGQSAERIKHWGEQISLKSMIAEIPDSLKMSSMTSDLRRSDHAPFWKNDYPAMMITDTADFRNKHYHCLEGIDSPDDLDYDFALDVTKAVTASAMELLQ